MSARNWASIGIFSDPKDRYAPYYREALEHAGIGFTKVDVLSSNGLANTDVLLLCGYGKLQELQRRAVHDWIESGGIVVCSGSSWGLHAELGLDPESRHASRGVLEPADSDRLWPQGAAPTLFLGAPMHRSAGCRVAVRANVEFVGAGRFGLGKGRTFFVAPHIGQTVCQMQLGRGVEVDGIGPADGTAQLDDCILRAEDGSVLDFERDRMTTERCNIPFFGVPHADNVREIWIRAVVEALEAAGRPFPIFWHWPGSAEGAAMLTIDCTTFEMDRVTRLHRVLSMFGCDPAWLVGTPGFALDVYRAFKSWDHEVGMLFVTDDESGWHEERLKIQNIAVGRATSNPAVLASRPADGKWKGWTTFYDMAESAGTRISLAKGGRQPGTAGFLFGTCHPFFPLKRDGTPYLVLEQPYCAYLPGIETPDKSVDHLIEQCYLRSGCFHVGISLEAAEKPAALDALRRAIAMCKQRRMQFVKPQDLYKFERTRRGLRVFLHNNEFDTTMSVASDHAVERLTVMFVGAKNELSVRGRETAMRPVERYGAKMWACELNLEAKVQADIRLGDGGQEKAA